MITCLETVCDVFPPCPGGTRYANYSLGGTRDENNSPYGLTGILPAIMVSVED